MKCYKIYSIIINTNWFYSSTTLKLDFITLVQNTIWKQLCRALWKKNCPAQSQTGEGDLKTIVVGVKAMAIGDRDWPQLCWNKKQEFVSAGWATGESPERC